MENPKDPKKPTSSASTSKAGASSGAKSSKSAFTIKQGYRNHWAPANRTQATPAQLSRTAINRIQKDLLDIQQDPIEGCFVNCDEANISMVDVLMTGPSATPYEGGFFWFYINFTTNYPFEPPKVKFMTTNGDDQHGKHQIRFNPNMYCCGKVCLSILGTWQGPPWTSIMSLKSLIISLRSLMTDNPIQNEPGFDRVPLDSNAALSYNRYIAYCSLKFAAVKHVKKKDNLPEDFRELVIMTVQEDRPYYARLCRQAKERYPKPDPAKERPRKIPIGIPSSLQFASTSFFKGKGKLGSSGEKGGLFTKLPTVSPVSSKSTNLEPNISSSVVNPNESSPSSGTFMNLLSTPVCMKQPGKTSPGIKSPQEKIASSGDTLSPKQPTKPATSSKSSSGKPTKTTKTKYIIKHIGMDSEMGDMMSIFSGIPSKRPKLTKEQQAEHKKKLMEQLKNMSSPFEGYATQISCDWDELLAEIDSDEFKQELGLI